MLGIHIPLMFVVGLGVLPLMRTGMKIVRLEGAFLLACYIAYTVMLSDRRFRCPDTGTGSGSVDSGPGTGKW